MEVQRKLASLDVILWLRENYKVGKNGSVSKNSVYQHYFDSCQEKGIEPVISATYFGKLVKRAFPGIKYNRKGPRGSAVQHYTCLKRAKIGVDGVAGASPYPEYGTPGGGAVIAGGAFTAEELALCQYSLKRERLEHADPDSPSLDHSPGTFSPRRRQAMFPHPFTPSTHGYPPPPSSSHRHHHPPPPPHSHVPHYSHQHQHQHQHQHTQHFASEAPTHAYHRAPPSSHTRDAGGRSPTDDELSAPWTLEGDHSATPPPPPMSTMMRGSHAPPTVLAYQAQHRHQHAALAHARSRASPHPYDFEERHHQPHQPHHLSPDLGGHSHPYRHEYPAHHSSHYGHPAVHLRSPSLPLGYPVDRDHGHDHDHDHHHHHHHQQQQHPYYHHHQQLPQRGSAPLLPSPRGHASSSGANPHHPHTGHRFQAMLRGHASHTSAANSSPTSPSGSSHIGSSNPPSPPSPPPHLLLPSLDSAAFATPLLPSATTISSNSSASTAVATTSSGASVGGLRNAPPATDGHHHYQQQEQHNNRHNAADVVAAASTAPSTDETSHDRQQRHQAPAATSASSPELAIGAGPASSVPNAFEPSMEDMYPLPTFAGEDLERHQAQPPQHSHHQQQHHQPLRPPLGRSSSPALEHLLRGIASRDVEDEELVSFYDHYLKA